MQKYFTLKEVSEITGLSLITLNRYIKSGRLHVVRVGERAIRVPESELSRLIRPYDRETQREENGSSRDSQ
ncbi:MAG: helix-turn-helix domain-containing protein [Syntrophorhabdus sp.]